MANTNPKVSVVIPFYNSEEYINEAVFSILNQSMSNFELLLINDGSKDHSVEILNSIKDDRMTIINNKDNKGNYFARNLGIGLSRGKYIAMMDSDDISHRNRLQLQTEYLDHKKHVGAIGSSFKLIDDKGNNLGIVVRPNNYQKFKISLLNNNSMLQSSLMIRKHLVDKHGLKYNTEFRYASDYDFVYQCSRLFYIYNLNDAVLSYRVHNSQISQQKKEEQLYYANLIRFNQFVEFGPEFNTQETRSLLEKAFNSQPVSDAEYENLIELMDSLITANNEKKIYSRRRLRPFLERILYASAELLHTS